MKQVFLILAFALTIVGVGCSSGGGSDQAGVSIEGNIYNVDQTASFDFKRDVLDELLKVAHAAGLPFNSSMSGLLNVDNPTQLPPVVGNDLVEVSAVVTNEGDENTEPMTVMIEVEHSAFITPERWSCWKCYSNDQGGSGCNGIWHVEGGTILEPQPEPVLEQCETVNETATQGICIDNFNNGYDCSSPTWKVEYEEPGNGLWMAYTPIPSLKPEQSHRFAVGTSLSGISNVRSDHYARYTIIDQANELVVERKDYKFDVVAQ